MIHGEKKTEVLLIFPNTQIAFDYKKVHLSKGLLNVF